MKASGIRADDTSRTLQLFLPVPYRVMEQMTVEQRDEFANRMIAGLPDLAKKTLTEMGIEA